MELDDPFSAPLRLERLNPKNDFLFGRLFGEEEGQPLLISLLNAVLRRGGKQEITSVTIMDKTRLGRELIDDKEVVLDLLCEVDGEEMVNIEMQVRRFERMDYRSLYYLANILIDQIHRGQSYASLKRTIGINILDHHYFQSDKYHNTFRLYGDEEPHILLTDILELHFIECPKFQHVAFDIHDPLHRWLRFLDQRTTSEQLEELMKMDETIREAEARLSYLASDEETRRLYAIREKALHDRASWLEDAREEGRQEGKEEMLKAIVMQMLQEGFTVTVISKATGLDEKQIEDLGHSGE